MIDFSPSAGHAPPVAGHARFGERDDIPVRDVNEKQGVDVLLTWKSMQRNPK